MNWLIASLAAGMAAMLLFEFFNPARKFPKVKFWIVRALLMVAIQVGVVTLGNFLWDKWFSGRTVFQLSHLHSVLSILIAFAVISFVSYWQHRLKHRVDFLWRFFHQVHHAPSRVEILTSFYRNPFEILVNMFCMSGILYGLLGCDAHTAQIVVFIMGAADLFYHWNIRTPPWLGYLIQRPEAHCIHHLAGVHAYNYGDIPLWDMLFGTYRNIVSFNGTCGFGAENERSFLAMLAGRDLSGKRLRH